MAAAVLHAMLGPPGTVILADSCSPTEEKNKTATSAFPEILTS
jgi:hypothetical protein